MLSYKFIENFKEILARLSALGYNHQDGIMSATDYGIPQTRKRCFMISKLNGPAPRLPKPRSLTTCLKDYLEVEPVAPHYYLSDDRIRGLIWSNEKEQLANRGFKFEPTDGNGIAHSITTHSGQRKTDNFVKINGRPGKMLSIEILGVYGSGFIQTRSIFGISGLCPTLWARMGKDPIKILVGPSQ